MVAFPIIKDYKLLSLMVALIYIYFLNNYFKSFKFAYIVIKINKIYFGNIFCITYSLLYQYKWVLQSV